MGIIWNPKGGEGIIYPPWENEVPVSYTKVTNPNINAQDWGSDLCGLINNEPDGL